MTTTSLAQSSRECYLRSEPEPSSSHLLGIAVDIQRVSDVPHVIQAAFSEPFVSALANATPQPASSGHPAMKAQ
jgi:hypothetical protein